MKVRDEKLKAIIDWSKNNRDIRAVLLTSSLVNPLAPVDDFSDLDIELIFENNPNIFEILEIILEIQLQLVEEDETYLSYIFKINFDRNLSQYYAYKFWGKRAKKSKTTSQIFIKKTYRKKNSNKF